MSAIIFFLFLIFSVSFAAQSCGSLQNFIDDDVKQNCNSNSQNCQCSPDPNEITFQGANFDLTNGCCFTYVSTFNSNVKNCNNKGNALSHLTIEIGSCFDMNLFTSSSNPEIDDSSVCMNGFKFNLGCSESASPCTYSFCVKNLPSGPMTQPECCATTGWNLVKAGTTFSFSSGQVPGCNCPISSVNCGETININGYTERRTITTPNTITTLTVETSIPVVCKLRNPNSLNQVLSTKNGPNCQFSLSDGLLQGLMNVVDIEISNGPNSGTAIFKCDDNINCDESVQINPNQILIKTIDTQPDKSGLLISSPISGLTCRFKLNGVLVKQFVNVLQCEFDSLTGFVPGSTYTIELDGSHFNSATTVRIHCIISCDTNVPLLANTEVSRAIPTTSGTSSLIVGPFNSGSTGTCVFGTHSELIQNEPTNYCVYNASDGYSAGDFVPLKITSSQSQSVLVGCIITLSPTPGPTPAPTDMPTPSPTPYPTTAAPTTATPTTATPTTATPTTATPTTATPTTATPTTATPTTATPTTATPTTATPTTATPTTATPTTATPTTATPTTATPTTANPTTATPTTPYPTTANPTTANPTTNPTTGTPTTTNPTLANPEASSSSSSSSSNGSGSGRGESSGQGDSGSDSNGDGESDSSTGDSTSDSDGDGNSDSSQELGSDGEAVSSSSSSDFQSGASQSSGFSHDASGDNGNSDSAGSNAGEFSGDSGDDDDGDGNSDSSNQQNGSSKSSSKEFSESSVKCIPVNKQSSDYYESGYWSRSSGWRRLGWRKTRCPSGTVPASYYNAHIAELSSQNINSAKIFNLFFAIFFTITVLLNFQ